MERYVVCYERVHEWVVVIVSFLHPYFDVEVFSCCNK